VALLPMIPTLVMAAPGATTVKVGSTVIVVNLPGTSSVVPPAFKVQNAVVAPEEKAQRSVAAPETSEIVVGFTTAVTERWRG
jgi:hypothetical protein